MYDLPTAGPEILGSRKCKITANLLLPDVSWQVRHLDTNLYSIRHAGPEVEGWGAVVPTFLLMYDAKIEALDPTKR